VLARAENIQNADGLPDQTALAGPRRIRHLPKAALPPQLQSPDRFLMVNPSEDGKLALDE
jgi:hypothetical protein